MGGARRTNLADSELQDERLSVELRCCASAGRRPGMPSVGVPSWRGRTEPTSMGLQWSTELNCPGVVLVVEQNPDRLRASSTAIPLGEVVPVWEQLEPENAVAGREPSFAKRPANTPETYNLISCMLDPTTATA
jgi:hypothetical protein